MTGMTLSPLIALIGLPNAGKSTLLNKLTGTKKAITAREAHTTRDLNYAETEWEGYYLRFVDTGGLVPDPSDIIQKEIQIKSASAIAQADILIWVIDRRQDPDTIRDELLQKIWKAGKPFLVCINKVDDPNNDKDIAEYAKLGGFGFVNVSGINGYGVNILLDMLVEKASQMGFEQSVQIIPQAPRKERKKTKTPKEVHTREDGGYYIIRQSDESGPGLYESVSESKPLVVIETVIVDLFGVTLHSLPDSPNEYGIIQSTLQSLKELKQQNKKLLYLSNSSNEIKKFIQNSELNEIFDGGLTSEEAGYQKPDLQIFADIIQRYELNPETTVFIDDTTVNVESSIQAGMWGINYTNDETDISIEINTIELGKRDRIKKLPKLLLLGRPNVGKSTLFNVLAKDNIQIITDIPGTTLSVNDTIIEYASTHYILLDSAGIRKAGQRTFGSESFATYRTIQTAYQADVILFMIDATIPLSHQDQVVAGIIKESKKGVVVIANKADSADIETRKNLIRDFVKRFAFLKVESFVWLSAKGILDKKTEFDTLEDETQDFRQSIVDIDNLWNEIDRSLRERSKSIDEQEVRKLFNYLMKQRPPKKLRNKKKAICYDLLFTKQTPPTFELLVKDKSTIHWSYIRFLENIIRQQFRFSTTGIVVKLTEVDRKKILT